MLILRTLQWGPQHGHGIGQTIRDAVRRSAEGRNRLALSRAAAPREAGLAEGRLGRQQGQPAAKFYRLTPEGKKQLVREESRWAQLVNAIGRVMKPAPAPGTEE